MERRTNKTLFNIEKEVRFLWVSHCLVVTSYDYK